MPITDIYNQDAGFGTPTSGFGRRTPPTPGASDNHTGTDIPAPDGTTVPAGSDGVVWFVGNLRGYGLTVIIEHFKCDANGNIVVAGYTLYGHLSATSVGSGQQVVRGQPIGQVGSSGTATGPHLHIETRDGASWATAVPKNPETHPGYASPNNRRPGRPADWEFQCPPPVPPFDTPSPPPRRDPLILDLDGNGFQTVGLAQGTYFDHDGDGFAEKTGWVLPGDGLLVWDRNEDGRINNGNELFGDNTLLKDGTQAVNGFEALAEWDDNGDGRIDVNDAVWSKLRVWANNYEDSGSGDSAEDNLPGPFYTLDELGITAINLTTAITNTPDGQGNTQIRLASFERSDGTTGGIAEYRFQRDTTDAITNEYLPVPDEIAVLPDLPGQGKVYDLHQAFVRDPSGSLKNLVETFIAQTDPAARTSILQQLIFKWTGAENIAPNSRGPFMDARKLHVMERYYGQDFVWPYGRNPNVSAAVLLDQSYRDLSERFYAQLMVQSHISDLNELITYQVGSDFFHVESADVSAPITQLQTELTTDPESGKVRLSEFARTLRGLGLQDTVNYLSFRETFIQQDESLGFVIDSGGLPFRPQTNLYGHYLGTNQAEAMLRDPTRGDAFINGYSGADVLYGSDRHEYLIQELGDSVLIAGGGNDRILAGAGDDLLDGGPGNDLLYGEAGSDTYIFRRGSGRDVIFDANVPHVYAQIAQAIQKPQLRV